MNRVNDHIKLLETYKRNEPTILADRTNTSGALYPSLNLKSQTVTPFALASMLVLRAPLDVSGSPLQIQMYELAFDVLFNEIAGLKRSEIEQIFKIRLMFAVKLMDKGRYELCYLQLTKIFVDIKKMFKLNDSDAPCVQQMIHSIPYTTIPGTLNGFIASFHTVLLQYVFKEEKVLVTPDQLVESMSPDSNFWQWFHSLDRDGQAKRSPTLIKLFLSYTQYPNNVSVPVGSQICFLLITLRFSQFTNSVPLEIIFDNLHSTVDRLISGNRLESIKRQCLPFLEPPQENLLDFPKYQSLLLVFGDSSKIDIDQFANQDSIQQFNGLINNLIVSSKNDDALQDSPELESILKNSDLFSTSSIQNDSFMKHIYKLVSFIVYSDNVKHYQFLPIIAKQFKASDSLSLTTVTIEILDLIVRFAKSLDPTLHHELLYELLTDVFKIFYKRLPDYLNESFLNRIRDISNIFFQIGLDVFEIDFKASLKHWMSSIELEYVILVQPGTTQKNPSSKFESLKLKNDRIVHKLINNSSFPEAQEFLSNSFKIYNDNVLKPSSKLSFFQKEKLFSKTLDISLKLLAKLSIKSSEIDLVLLSGGSSSLMTLIVGSLFNILASTSLLRKNEVIRHLVQTYLLSNKDTGLTIYVAIQYFKIADIDMQFFKLNPKVTIDKKSCLADYSHLFIAFSLVIVCLQNRQVNQRLITKSFDSFIYWLKKKSLFVIENYEDKTLLNLEFELVYSYVNYASYHGLYAYASTLITVYKSERSFSLSSTQEHFLDGKLFDLALELKSSEKANALLISRERKEKDFASKSTTANFLELLEWRLRKYHSLIIAERNEDAETEFFQLNELFDHSEHLDLSNKSMTRLKLVHILILQSEFLCLSSILFTQSIPHQSYKLGRLSLKILQSLVKKFLPNLSNLPVHKFNDIKWQVSRLMLKVLKQSINLFVCWSLTKQVEFYLNELVKFLESHNIPVVFCYSSYFMAEVSLISGNTSKASEFLVQGDAIHEEMQITDYLLDLSHLAAHGFYFMVINETNSATDCYGKFCQLYDTMLCAKQFDPTTLEIKDILTDGMLRQFRYFDGDQILLKQMCTKFEVNLILCGSPMNLEIIDNFRSSHSIVQLAKEFYSNPHFSNGPTILMEASSLRDNNRYVELIKNCNNDPLFHAYHWKKLSDFCVLLKHQFNEFEVSWKYSLSLNENALSKAFKLDKDVAQLKEGPNQILPDMDDIHVLSSCENSYEVNLDIVSRVQSNLFPEIIVIQVGICSVTGDMLLSRFSSTEDLSIFRIPFNERLSWKQFMNEFNDIIEASKLTTNQERTMNVKTKADRKDWWKERRDLDLRLQTLLESFENDHLGVLKAIFSLDDYESSVIDRFSCDLKEVLNCDFDTKTEAFNSRLFLTLGHPKNWTSSTDLKNLIKYVTGDDLLDVEGESLLIKNLLEKYHDNIEQAYLRTHVLLIPSKECLEFPWESLPVLQTKSISRMPSLEMLNDLLIRSSRTRYSLNPERVFYLLNPSGDLTRTEATFKEKLQSKIEWKGITDERPTESQFKEGLQKDLFIYLGHGSGQQYIKSKTIKRQDQCSSSLLIGCSSGALKGNNSLLEPYGPVIDYLIAGAPMLLVNMWDVTDKDIDKFTMGVFDFWGLFERYPKEMNISEAVALSRDLCTLRFLNGGAPAVYGLPLKLRQ